MNKIYKLKFDKRRNELVVVSEIASGLGKEKSTGHIAGLSALFFKGLAGRLTPLSLLTGLILGALPMMTVAASLPVGGQVVAGQGSISVSGNAMTVQQSSQNMAANWQSFDIGKSHRVEFVQPDSSAIALNRVTGASASRIMGTLNANGRVFLVNPNGVVFGKDASVNTAGLVATTRDISTADFMKGKYTLRGESDAAVINQGSLKAGRDGFIVLAGSRVSNQGTIRTAGGKVVLAAAEQIHLQLDNSGLTGVTVSGNVVNALVDNQGLISAQNGQVYLTARGKAQLLKTVVKNSGTIEAQGLSSHGGVIRLDGGDSGVVSQSGTLLADSATDKGGRVVLEGKNIHLASGSRTSATGKKGGGSVHVGGGWKGQDSTIKNADRVVMSRGAAIDVSATGEGKGGTAVLWSETYTDFQGDIAARGGVTGGDGGKVETSSRRNLQAFGDVDASAPGGRGGQWLIDPTDVTIVSADTSTNVTASGGDVTGAALDTDTVHLLQPSAAGAQVSAAKIKTQLDKGTSVTVETSGSDVEGQKGNITVSASIDKTAGADATLTLKADKDITFSDGVNVNSTTGALGLSLLAGKGENASVTLTGNNTITLNGGDLYVGPQPQADERAALNNISLTANRGVNITAGNMTFDTAGGVRATNSADNAASAVKLNATGDLTINAQAGNIDLSGRATTIAATKNILFTTGNATLGRDINITSSGGDFTLRPAGDGGASVNFTNNGKIDAAGNITLDVSKGLRGLYYSLVAGKDLTVNGPVSLRAGWAVPSALTAGGLLKLTADSGNITFDSSDTTNNGGNITLSAGKGINITAKAGKVELKSAAGDKNSLNVTATKGDVVLSARTNGVRAIRLEKALLTASEGNVSLQGTSGADTENAVDVRRGSVLTASQDITLTGQGGQTGLYLDNAILNATRTVTLKGVGDEKGLLIYNARVTSENTSAHGRSGDTSWVGSEGLGLLGTSNLTAKQNISLSGSGLKGVLVAGSARAEAGEKLSINGYSGEYESGMGVALTTNASSALLKGKEVAITGTATASRGIRIEATKASIEAAERIVLKGTVRSGGEGVTVGNSDITLNAPVVSIEGNADKGVYFWGRGNTLNAAGVTDTLSISGEGGASGVLLNNLSLTAGNNLSIKGSGRTTGLDLTTLNLTITDPTKLSLSSAGSAAGAVNRLGAQAFGGADGLVSLVKKGIENRTLVNVTGASDSAADNKVIDNNRVSLVNLGKKLSGDGASTADTVIDLTHRASEGETARRGDWDFSAVDNITATTGDVIIKGVAGFGDSFTLNAAAGNIAIQTTGNMLLGSDSTLTAAKDVFLTSGADVALGNNATVTAVKDIIVSSDAGVRLGDSVNITSTGGDFKLLQATPEGGAMTSLSFTDKGKIDAAGNITLDAGRGVSGSSYTLKAGKDLTVNGAVSASARNGATSAFSAGEQLTLTAESGNITFDSSVTENNGGNITLSAKGINITAKAGKVELKSAAGENNSLNVTTAEGDIVIAGTSGQNGVILDSVDMRATSGDVTLRGEVTGTRDGSKTGVLIQGNSALQGKDITLAGKGATGVKVGKDAADTGNTLNVTGNLNVTGSGTASGFDLSGLNLTVAGPDNIHLSSAESAATAVNRLGNGAFGGADGLVKLVKKGIENTTIVNVSGVTDGAAENKVVNEGKVSLVNLSDRVSGESAVSKDGIEIDLSLLEKEGETTRRGDWGFSAVDNITATTGDVIIKGVAGFGDSFTLNAAAGNIAIQTTGNMLLGSDSTLTAAKDVFLTSGADVALGNNATVTAVKDIIVSSDAGVRLGDSVNITSTGGDFKLLQATPEGGAMTSLSFTDKGKIDAAGNITLDAGRGVSGSSYTLKAGKDLTVNGAVSASARNGATSAFSAGEQLTLTAESGNITFDSSVTENNGGNITLSAKDINITAKAGKVELKSAAGDNNSLNISSEGNVTLAGALNNRGDKSVILDAAAITAKGDVTVSGNGNNQNNVDIRNNAAIKAGNITLNGQGGATGVYLDRAVLTANDGGTITLNGSGSTNGDLVHNTTLNTSGVITLTGEVTGARDGSKTGVLIQGNSVLQGKDITLTGKGATGVKVGKYNDAADTGNTLSVTGNLNVTGSGTASGFDLTGLNLSIAAPDNIHLSSAESAATAVNRLGNQAFAGETGLVALVKKGIENATQVNTTGMTTGGDDAGKKIFTGGTVDLEKLTRLVQSASETTGNDTRIDLSASGENARAGGWSFNKVSDITNTTGNITLRGVSGIGEGVLNASAGNITITVPQGGFLGVTSGNNLTMTAGKVLTVDAAAGNVVFDASGNGNITLSGAEGVSITAGNGGLKLKGRSGADGNVSVTSSAGDIALTNTVAEGTEGGVQLGHAVLNAAPANAIVITGQGNNRTDGVTVRGGSMTAQDITLNGTANGWATGVSVAAADGAKPELNATASVNVSGRGGRGGFNLSGLADDFDGTKLTLSSAGSEGVNNLDQTVVKDTNTLVSLIKKGIDNTTSLNMTGVTDNAAILDDGRIDLEKLSSLVQVSAPEEGVSGKKIDLSGGKTGGWNLGGLGLKAIHAEEGDVVLKGVGSLSDINLKATKGNVTVTAPKGGFIGTTRNAIVEAGDRLSVIAPEGDLNFDASTGGGRINLKGETGVEVRAEKGSVKLKGGNGTDKMAEVVTVNNDVVLSGNMSVAGNHSYAVDLENAKIISQSANVSIDGRVGSVSTWGPEGGGVSLSKTVSMVSQNTNIKGVSVPAHGGQGQGVGVSVDSFGSFSFTGNTTIDADSKYGAGILFKGSKVATNGSPVLTFNKGKNKILARTETQVERGNGSPPAAISAHGYGDSPGTVTVNLNEANLTIEADASKSKAYGIGLKFLNASSGMNERGFVFRGTGDVDISAKADTKAGMQMGVLDNRELTGKVKVTGESNTGPGIEMYYSADIHLKNATVEGTSRDGAGILIRSDWKKGVSLNGNTLKGTTTDGSAGIAVSGKNVRVEGGTLTGHAGGNGVGVLINGGSDYVISDATITGNALNGVGIAAEGNLIVENNATLRGEAKGTGNGVSVRGTLSNRASGDDTPEGVNITGKADSGTGIAVVGSTTLTNTVLSGTSASGTGVDLANTLTMTGEKGDVTGKSNSGTGVRLAAGLDGAKVKGESSSGDGIQLLNNTEVKSSTLDGQSKTESGIAVQGGVTLDETTAKTLKATSESGTGLSLDNAGLRIVDADNMPVTTAVSLSGSSVTGTGIASKGDSSITGVKLDGKSTGTGTGVRIENTLTVTDSISGVSAGAGNGGKGLVLKDAVINAPTDSEGKKALDITATAGGSGGVAVTVEGSSTLTDVTLQGEGTGGAAGVLLKDATLSDGVLSGTSDAGSGVTLAGNVSLTEDVVKNLKATSESGTGLSLDNAGLRIVDADNKPVTTAVSLSGSSVTGTGIASKGDSSITGVKLDGKSTGTGTGVSVDGRLAVSDTVSGISATTGKGGTGLVLTGATVEAPKLKEEGKTLDVAVTVTGSDSTAVVVGGKTTLTDVTLSGDGKEGATGVVLKNATLSGSLSGTSDTGTGVKASGNVAGGSVSGRSTSGEGVTLDSAVLNGATLAGGSDSGTGISVQGNTRVTGSVLEGTTATGHGVDVKGTLSSDGASTVDGKATGTGGVGVDIAASSSVTGGKVSGTATDSTAVKVGRDTTLANGSVSGRSTSGEGVTLDSAVLNGATLAGGSDSGTGISVQGNTRVTGSVLEGTTATGHGVDVKGTLSSDGASTVDGKATGTGGVGVDIAASSSVTGGKVSGTATDSTAVKVGRDTTLANGSVSGRSTSGEGVTLDSAVLNGATLAGGSDSGTGISVQGNTRVTGSVLEGTTATGHGVDVKGTLSSDGASTVDGKATGTGGVGVDIAASSSVTGGKVSGTATDSTAVKVGRDTTLANGSVSGRSTSGEGVTLDSAVLNGATLAGGSDSGTGISVQGNTRVTGSVLEGTTATGHGVDVKGTLSSDGASTVDGKATGTGGVGVDIAASSSVTGGKVSGTATDSTAVKVGRDTTLANGSVSGRSTSGEGVTLDSAVLNGATLAGGSDSGAGISVQGNTRVRRSVLEGTTATGHGVDVKGTLSSDGASTVDGKATGTGGVGVDIASTASVSGGKISGSAIDNNAVKVGSGATVKDTALQGSSQSGTAIDTGGVQLEGVSIDVGGISLNAIQGPVAVTEGAINAVATMRSQAPSMMGGDVLPAVLQTYYRSAEKKADINIHHNGNVKQLVIDANRPADETTKAGAAEDE